MAEEQAGPQVTAAPIKTQPAGGPKGALGTDTQPGTKAGSRGRGWLRPFLKPLMPTFREVAVISFFVNLSALAAPIFVLQVYDRVVYHAGLSTLQGLVIGMVVLLGFDFILRQARSRIMQTVALRLESQVGRRLFDKLTGLPLGVLENRPTEFWQRLFRDVDTVRNTLSGASAILVCDLPFAILFLGLVFIIAEPVAVVLLVALAVFLVLAVLSGRSIQNASEQEKDTLGSRDALLGEILQGRATVKALALDGTLKPAYEDRLAAQVENAIHRGGRVDSYSNLGAVISVVTTVSMTTVGALAIIEQQMTIGGLIAANMLSGRLLQPLNQLMGTWRTFAGFRQAAQRLGEVFAMPEDRRDSVLSLDRPKGILTLSGITFRYGKDANPSIDGVTVEIRPGGMTAILGANGSGKSTLMKLIMGLYHPEAGRVLLDGADIAQFTRRELADRVGFLPQETILFAGSIRDNIAMGLPGLSDGDIAAAARAAAAHDLIVDLPDGYATQVGEGGRRLSGGMRQRIALARALAGNRPVILLDEPSSSLDRQAEEALCETLHALARDRTILIVTHSPVLLSRCASALVLERGKVAMGGPAREILPRVFPPRGQPAKAAPSSQTAPQAAPVQPVPSQPGSPQPGSPKAAPPQPAASSAMAQRFGPIWEDFVETGKSGPGA